MRPQSSPPLSGRRGPALVLCVLSIIVATVHVANGQAHAPGRGLRFTVEIDGIAAGRFAEASGIGIETEVIEYRDGGTNDVRKLPGRTKWPDIVLKRAFTGNTVLYDWAMTIVTTGNVVKRDLTIAVHDPNGKPVARYYLENAWPVKWEGPTLKASGNEVAIETLVLAHEGLSLVEPDR